MRKRLLGILLSSVMALSQLPVIALADAPPTGGDGSADGCRCTQLCGEDSIDQACPVCSVEGYTACSFTQTGNSAPGDSAPSALSDLEDIEITSDGITYLFDLYADGMTACLTDIVEPAEQTAVAVPSSFEYDGETYTVTKLSWGFFSSKRNNITALTLPDTLTDVGSTSFGKFPNLTELTIPGSIRVFGGSFQGMRNLKTLTFAEGVEEISSNMMVSGCSALTTIILPDSLRTISGPGAFSDAAGLTNITLPEGIAITEGSLFSDCTALEEIHLPASVTEIRSSMFEGCTSLKKVSAASPITAIGTKAFSGCTSLTEIPDLGRLTEIESYVFKNCNLLAGPLDLSHVTKVGYSSFDACYSLTGELDLTNLTEIPNYAFRFVGYWADGISLKFGPNLTSIGSQAFSYAPIQSLELPESLTSIGSSAFNQCAFLTGTVAIPDTVTSIGTNAFSGTNVEVFEIGSGLTEIPADALASGSLKEIIVNNSADAVTGLPEDDETIEIVYKIASIDDSVGDSISDAPASPTLQEAVNAAAKTGGTVTLGKHVKLGEPVTIPAGETVTITTDGTECWILPLKTGYNGDTLFSVEEGASVIFTGNLVLSGRYHSGSILDSQGVVTLADGVLVRDGKVSSLFGGVIKASGENAQLLLDGGIVTENQVSGSSSGIVSVSDGAEFVIESGSVEGNKITGDSSYSGAVRVSGGASIALCGGSIQHNNASDTEPLNSTGGLLLYGNAGGSMSGGNISNNTGHRGSAVLLWGYDDDHRTAFTMTDGSISENTSSMKDNISPSGAVHVENNAEFTMTGGNITGNSASAAGVGGGVCVVDGAIQQSRPEGEYHTAFLFNGGAISNNRASYGGGIYTYSNGVELKAGRIEGNQAFEHGGVYGEGREPYYSTFSITNALVTNNTARQGGGMMLCATGSADVYVTEGIAIFGNHAQDDPILGASAGDDFAFTASGFGMKEGIVTLADRILGGGAALWYQDGGVSQAATGVYPNTNPNVPRYGEEGADAKPVKVIDSQQNLALKTVVSEEAQELARLEAKLIITGNSAQRGGGIGANGGIVIGDPDTTQVTVSKAWAGDTAASRPASVTVNLLNGSRIIDTIELTAAGNWTHTFRELPTHDADGTAYSYSVSEVAVEGYTTQITGDAQNGFTITNTKSKLPDPGYSYIDITVEKNWVLDNGGTLPGSITVDLLRDNRVFQTVELNPGNDWTYTWEALSNQYNWSVVETKVPAGFTSTVRRSGNTFFIINDDIATTPGGSDGPGSPVDPDHTGDSADPNQPSGPNPSTQPGHSGEAALPQTGQLWWPVWLMVSAGVVLVLVGIVNKTRYHGKHEK